MDSTANRSLGALTDDELDRLLEVIFEQFESTLDRPQVADVAPTLFDDMPELETVTPKKANRYVAAICSGPRRRRVAVGARGVRCCATASRTRSISAAECSVRRQGRQSPGDPQHSYRNILKMGFRESYVRENYAPPRDQSPVR